MTIRPERPDDLPRRASVIVIGGGVIGCSVAYHLARAGVSDVTLLERRQLTSGTTWHAAGLVGQLRTSINMTELARYTSELYLRLEAETGQATGYRRCGSISIATNEERFEELRRSASMAKVFGLEVNVVTPAAIKARVPLLHTPDVLGGIHIPSDGYANAVDVTNALARGARNAGAHIFQNLTVTAIRTALGSVTGVTTEHGDIDADCVVLCTGMWTRDLAATVGVNVPLHACEHYYALFESVAGLDANFPVVRDYDACAYYKYDAGRLLIGAFEPRARPWAMEGIPEDFCFDEIAGSLEHFEPILEQAMVRVPALESAGLQTFFCGPESFTPDVRYHVGQAPELDNCFVAAGLNSIGLQSAGGIGKVITEWIRLGHPPSDLWEVDVRRNQPFQRNRKYLRERVSESLGLLYATHYPYRQYDTARGVRRSPLHDRLQSIGACHGEVAGWERPNWYAPEPDLARYEYSYGRQNWFEHSAAEHRAVRERVGLFDLSSFAKFRLQGRDAARVLNYVCANDVDVRPGRIVYTQWLNARGGIEADLTVTPGGRKRLSDRDRRSHGNAGLSLAATAHSGRRPLCADQCNLGHGRDFDHGAERSGAVAIAEPERSLARGLPLRAQPGNRARLRAGARRPDHLRRRTRLGTLHPRRVHDRRLRHHRRRGRTLRPGPRRLSRPGFAAHRKSISSLGPRHHRRGYAAGSGPGLCREVRQAGRVHRTGGAVERQEGGAGKAVIAVPAAGPTAVALPQRTHLARGRPGRLRHVRRLRPHPRRGHRPRLRRYGQGAESAQGGTSASRWPGTAFRRWLRQGRCTIPETGASAADAGLGDRGHCPLENSQRLVDLRSADVQRRRDADHVL